jgi:SAM-dependent methyltransferase
MLLNSEEYQAMFEVEENLWWYKILHKRVLDEVLSFSNDKNIEILDAGCGTGGLLLQLKKHGFSNVSGFDFNDDAVFFSKNRGHNVQKLDITNLENKFLLNSFDIIISNDVLYQFEDNEIENALNNILSFLKPNGIFITNNNSFNVFRGIHDIAVGSKKRFVLQDFKKYLKIINQGHIIKSLYWPFLLSPLLLIIRQVQNLKIRLKLINPNEVKSDVEMPSAFINQILFQISVFEMKFLKKAPFGSSLFMVIKKK